MYAQAVGLVPAMSLPEGPGVARCPVTLLDIAEAPLDLRGGAGLPVGTGAGHLGARQRLGDPVGAARIRRGHAPAALPGPDVVQAAELARAEAERRQHRVRDVLGRARTRDRRVDGGTAS